jgi:hypothetical protein
MRRIFLWAVALSVLPVSAGERKFDFGEYPVDQTPLRFHSTVAGRGKPGDWRVILDEVPPALQPLSSKAPSVSRRAVLGQVAREGLANHFPMLIFEDENLGDFRLTTRFKIVGGAMEQAAGVVFHFQNASNFYVARASVLGGNFRCTKVVNGELKPPQGPELEVSKGVWHELSVECEGPRILCALDGTNVIKLIDAVENRPGKIGFWTEADSVSYFMDAKIEWVEKEPFAEKLMRDAVKEYPRLLGLKICAVTAVGKGSVVVASKDPREVGQPAGKPEQDVIGNGLRCFGKAKGSAFVVVPLRDRNGDIIAAVRVTLKTFPGQTGDNVLARAQPVVQKIQARVQSLEDLLQ